ncbi:MAG: MerR family transcriptional regulator [Alphaproteobacteria bacterium]|nr:MerR family transcriptional regulator [Alphaproteobacteria bacterium]
MSEPFISINELSKRLGVPAHTLRYWEKAFDGSIRPVTGAGGRRYYRDIDVQKIQAIRGLLYDQGYTIAGVRKLIASGDLITESKVKKGKEVKAEVIEPKVKSVTAVADSIQIDAALELLEKARAELSQSPTPNIS